MSLLEKLSAEDLADVVDAKRSVKYDKFLKDHLPLKQFEVFKQNSGSYIKQAVPLPNTAEPGYSSIYRNVLTRDGLLSRVVPHLDTILQHFDEMVAAKPYAKCLGTRLPSEDGTKFNDYFTFITYKEMQLKAKHFGSGLRNLLNSIKNEDEIISIFSPNRPEWVISSYACQNYDLTTTALYDTLGPKTSKYILNFTKSPVLVTTLDKIMKIVQLSESKTTNTNEKEELAGLPYLKFIVSMDDLNFKDHYGLIQLAESRGIKLVDFNQVEELGKKNFISTTPATSDSTLSISFTSGTTGYPKGVITTHKMAVASMTFSYGQIGFTNKEVEVVKYFSFLPLAHIYEMLNVYSNLARGYEIAFPPEPSPLTLIENLKIYKPHFVTLVPRVYTKLESAIKAGLSSGFVGKNVISKLVQYKERVIGETNESASKISKDIFSVDKPIVKKLKAAVGFDNVNLCISGSAPIAKETIQFIKAAFNVEFYQGYGLTESFSGVCIETSNQNDQTSGSIGLSTEIKLRDLPAMNYITHDTNGVELEEPRGELLLRGDQVFKGYYKNKKASDEVLSEDGWFSTGDVAKIDKYGRIAIIDRVKNFFKLAQGEYITPERIENIYLSTVSGLVTQMFVHGDSFQTFLVSIIGVDPVQVKASLEHYNKNHKVFKYHHLSDDQILEEINHSHQLKKFFLNYINHQVRDQGLQGFEKIHNFKFAYEPLKLDDGVITPTFKIKRAAATKFFEDELKKLYEEGSLLKEKL